MDCGSVVENLPGMWYSTTRKHNKPLSTTPKGGGVGYAPDLSLIHPSVSWANIWWPIRQGGRTPPRTAKFKGYPGGEAGPALVIWQTLESNHEQILVPHVNLGKSRDR